MLAFYTLHEIIPHLRLITVEYESDSGESFTTNIEIPAVVKTEEDLHQYVLRICPQEEFKKKRVMEIDEFNLLKSQLRKRKAANRL